MANKERNNHAKLWALAIAGMVMLNTPILVTANKPILVVGVPLLYFYVFMVWGLFIIGIYMLMRKS